MLIELSFGSLLCGIDDLWPNSDRAASIPIGFRRARLRCRRAARSNGCFPGILNIAKRRPACAWRPVICRLHSIGPSCRFRFGCWTHGPLFINHAPASSFIWKGHILHCGFQFAQLNISSGSEKQEMPGAGEHMIENSRQQCDDSGTVVASRLRSHVALLLLAPCALARCLGCSPAGGNRLLGFMCRRAGFGCRARRLPGRGGEKAQGRIS